MDALELLGEDHRHLRELLRQMSTTPAEDIRAREGLVARLEHDLAVHARMEEEVFYPALVADGSQEHKMLQAEALEEHRLIERQALPDLAGTPAAAPEFEGRAKALKELVEHHIGEEERDLFPLARSLMDTAGLNALGNEMARRRGQWIAQGGVGARNGRMPIDVAGWFSDRAQAMEEQTWRAAMEFAQDPARGVGRGVERAVGMSARLAGEVFGGIRRGLSQAKKETRDRERSESG